MGDAPESHPPQSDKQPRQEQDTELQNGTLEEEDTHASDALPACIHERAAADGENKTAGKNKAPISEQSAIAESEPQDTAKTAENVEIKEEEKATEVEQGSEQQGDAPEGHHEEGGNMENTEVLEEKADIAEDTPAKQDKEEPSKVEITSDDAEADVDVDVESRKTSSCEPQAAQDEGPASGPAKAAAVAPEEPTEVEYTPKSNSLEDSRDVAEKAKFMVVSDSNSGSNNDMDDLFNDSNLPPVDNDDPDDDDFIMRNNDENNGDENDNEEGVASKAAAEKKHKAGESEEKGISLKDGADKAVSEKEKERENADSIGTDTGDKRGHIQQGFRETINNLHKQAEKPPSPQAETTSSKEPDVSLSSLERQTHTIVLPSYSAWFSLSTIHEIERESLPEFFQTVNKNKTAEIYMKYRNFMINSYRLNPNDYLSYTAVRRNLIGDAGSLLRLHKFLTKWGLINYQVNPETRPKQTEPPYTGDFVIDYDTPRGMFPFESYKPPTTFPDLKKFRAILATPTTDAEEEKKDTEDSEQTLPAGGEPPLKKRKILKPDIDHNWDEALLQKLVEGVSKHKNDWYKIAEYVGGNKTPDECIIRFLQLPIEDKFLEDNKDALGPLKYIPNLSFSPNDNPIMSTLSFLVKMVDTDVVVAASNRAIKVMDKKLERKLNRFKDVETKANSTNDKDDALKDVKDAAVNTFGIIGARSHLFATFEEREMHRSLVNIIQHQLKIVDMKLAKLTSLEKEFELQRKHLEKKSSELLEEKLSIFKYNNAATSKLLQVISLLESKDDYKEVETSKIRDLITQSKEILYKPPRKQLNILEEGDFDESGENLNESVKPVSFEAPMLYRYWSG
ncbi:hypothetical protein PMKS-003973 [Pichia membranifaciens]|uniref:SWIRM domain-containing protein n=1 Tax=Pichia membranifaciens TaxID=4926 RepID=A0A1Q2YLQ4_9ASCO|nr:hypothetical protein PMKS-003973 [Pichia membranifaciens]